MTFWWGFITGTAAGLGASAVAAVVVLVRVVDGNDGVTQ